MLINSLMTDEALSSELSAYVEESGDGLLVLARCVFFQLHIFSFSFTMSTHLDSLQWSVLHHCDRSCVAWYVSE